MTLEYAIHLLNWHRHCDDLLWSIALDGSGEHALGMPRGCCHRLNVRLDRSDAIRLAMDYDREYQARADHG